MEALEQLAVKCWDARSDYFPREISFVYPQQTKTISVTGDKCELNCAHCGGHYLKHMKPLEGIKDGEELGSSCLVSGGCTLAGKVPLGKHMERLASLKQGRRFNLHVGLIDEEEIAGIAQIADKISFDFVGDDRTIEEVYGLKRTVDDYVHCYMELKAKCQVMPHICIGLYGGEIRGEYRAIELLRQLGTDGVTFIIFTPTRGTRFADRTPPEMVEVVKLLAHARTVFPEVAVQLGCMRPGGRYRSEIDKWAVRIGVNSIVNPAPEAAQLARSLGISVTRREECCAL